MKHSPFALYDIGGVLGGPIADALSEINIDELTSFPKWEVVLKIALMDIPLQVTPLLESWLPHADKNTCFFDFVLFNIVPHLKKDNPVRRQWINKSKGLDMEDVLLNIGVLEMCEADIMHNDGNNEMNHILNLEEEFPEQYEKLVNLFGQNRVQNRIIRLNEIHVQCETAWGNYLKKLGNKPVKYLLIAEAPPWSENDPISYFYSTFMGPVCKSVWKAFFNTAEPNDVDEALTRLAEKGFLLLDSLPFPMKYTSNCRDNPLYLELVKSCKSYLYKKLKNKNIKWAKEVKHALAFKLNGKAIINAFHDGITLPNGQTIQLNQSLIAADKAGFPNAKKLRDIWELDENNADFQCPEKESNSDKPNDECGTEINSKQNKSYDECHDAFYQILRSISKTHTLVNGIAPQMPSEVLPDLATIDHELDAIAQTINDLRFYFCSNPLDKWRKSQQLNREEFYLLAAQGIIHIPATTSAEEAYEEYAYYLYEDEERIGYINPSEFPDPPPEQNENGSVTMRTHFKLGIAPEDVRICFLRTDQLKYFKKHRPGLFSRFRKD